MVEYLKIVRGQVLSICLILGLLGCLFLTVALLLLAIKFVMVHVGVWAGLLLGFFIGVLFTSLLELVDYPGGE